MDAVTAHRSPRPLIKDSLQGSPPCPDKFHTKHKSPGIGLYLPIHLCHLAIKHCEIIYLDFFPPSPSFKYGSLPKINFKKPERNENIPLQGKRHPHLLAKRDPLFKELNIKINKGPVLFLVGSAWPRCPGGQPAGSWPEMWPCLPPNPLFLPAFLYCAEESAWDWGYQEPSFPLNSALRDSPGPCGHHSNMLSGRHALFSPWIVLMLIEYEQMKCLLNNVQCSIGRSHFWLLLNRLLQTGAGRVRRGRRKNCSSQRSNPQRGSVFCSHHPPDLASEFIFAKGFEGRS